MLVEVKALPFKQALAAVSRFIPKHAPWPVVENVLIEATSSGVELVGTNLTTTMKQGVAALSRVEEEGRVLVNAQVLKQAIQGAKGGSLVTLRQDDSALQVSYNGYNMRLDAQPADDYPSVLYKVSSKPLIVVSSVFTQALSRVLMAVAKDEYRPVLTGVLAEVEGDKLTLTAADGFRLAMHSLMSYPKHDPHRAVIPSSFFSKALPLLKQNRYSSVILAFDSAHASITFGHTLLITDCVEGNYPHYQPFLSTDYSVKAIVNADALREAVKAATAVAAGEENPVRLSVSAGQVDVSIKDIFHTALAANVEAKTSLPFNIAFFAPYLLDVLSGITGQVSMSFTSSTASGLFMQVESEDYKHVVMPMFVQW